MDFDIKRVRREHDLWDTAGLFSVKTGSQPMSFQLDRLHAYTVLTSHACDCWDLAVQWQLESVYMRV